MYDKEVDSSDSFVEKKDPGRDSKKHQGKKTMRVMNSEEMHQLINLCKWATICSVSPDHFPYAIEATPFHDGRDICFMINPRGGTWSNVQTNPKVLLKFTMASPQLLWWAGVSCHGTGVFDTDPDNIRRGWDLLGQVMNQDYSRFAEKFCARPERSPLFRVRVMSMTGRCSAAVGELLSFTAMHEEIQECCRHENVE